MRKTSQKLTSLILTFMMLCSVATFSVYADPDDNTISYNDNTVSDGGGDNPIVVDPEPYSSVVDPEPYSSVVDPEPIPSHNDDPISVPDSSYDDGQSNYDPEPPYSYDDGNNNNNNQQEISQVNPEPTINYDADYYNNMYGGNVIDYDINSDFNDDYQNAIVDNYNPGMSFEEFEMATDYQSATAVVDKTVDMYNSNGSIKEQNLSKKDWQEISLSFDKGSANGTGDFSFIKNNNSDQDSNFSILFLIVGILFILTAVSIVLHMIISSARRKKKSNTIS